MTPPIIGQSEKIKYLTKEQVTSLLSSIKSASIRDYAIFSCAYYHAMRVSEVGLLQFSDIDSTGKRIHISRIKNGVSNSYLIHDEVWKALKAWLKVRGDWQGPLFPSRKSKMEEGGVGITKSQLCYLFKLYAKKSKKIDESFTFHCLRHSCAVHMVEAGIDLRRIQDWLGHRNIDSTYVYAKVSKVSRDQTAEIFYGTGGGANEKVDPRPMVGKAGRKLVDWGKDKR